MVKRPERGRDSSQSGKMHAEGPGGEELRAGTRPQEPEELSDLPTGGEGEGDLVPTEIARDEEDTGVEAGAEEDADTRHAEDLANAAQEEIAALRDQLLRLAADFDNYRKRSLREQKDAREYGTTQLLNDILPVVDNLDRALQHAGGDDDPVTNGVRLVAKQFHDVLNKQGVKSFSSVGVPFDPERHEAVAQVPSADKQPGTVLEELQRGYTLRDRLLRPARVVVVAPPSTPASSGKPD